MAKNVVLVVMQAEVVKGIRLASHCSCSHRRSNQERWCPQVMIRIKKCFDLFYKALRSLQHEGLISTCV